MTARRYKLDIKGFSCNITKKEKPHTKDFMRQSMANYSMI